MSGFDFSYFDALTSISAGRGRLTRGRVAPDGRPMLLFVHGGYHGGWCFSNYLRYFDALAIPCAAMDMRGHGGLLADARFHRQGVRAMAEDVVACCEQLGAPAVVVGHSAGALVCAAAGECYPFAGLGLIAPSPPGQLEGLEPIPRVPDDAPVPPPDVATTTARFLGGVEHDGVEQYQGRLCPESPALLNERYSLAIHIEPSAFAIPAICISGGLDRGVRHPAGQDRDTAAFYGAEYHEIAEAPHSMMLHPGWETGANLIENWYRANFR